MDWILAATATEPSFLASTLTLLWTIFKVAAGLGFVIFVHELGHFLVAKACGVKCEKFYVGFDIPITVFSRQLPAKLFHFTWGETEYGIGILPLGGYVKMLGQDDDPRNAETEAERIRVKEKESAGEVLTADEFVDHAYGKLDPRSFPAKSVPARMAIISAGVIMNLIFAVILGAVAYRIGVPYVPAALGGTVVGSPAWKAGWQPGDKIVRIGKHAAENDYLRFDDDLKKGVIFNGPDRDMEFAIQKADGSRVVSVVRPIAVKPSRYPTLGIRPTSGLELAKPDKGFDYLNPEMSVPFEVGDKIESADGQPITTGWELRRMLAQNPDRPLPLTLSRKIQKDGRPTGETAKIETILSPLKARTVGIVVKPQEIAAVRPQSPADEAGLREGDQLLAIDGEPVGDPLTLAQRLLPKVGRDVVFKVARTKDKAAEELELKVVPQPPKVYDAGLISREPIGIDALGIGIRVEDTIAAVEPNSPAEDAGLKPGDELISVDLENVADLLKKDRKIAQMKDALLFTNEGVDWPYFHHLMQNLNPSTKVKLTYKRGTETKTVSLLPVLSETFYDEGRNLPLLIEQKVRQVHSVGEAFQLGARETWERLGEVVTTLSMLVTGRISPGDLSGPLGILTVAGYQASIGISKLLIFLTLLSANLAVVNFLPIPALDGGHMLFLAAEWIRGKPVDPNLQMRLTIGGVLALLALMVFVTVGDLGKIFL